LNLQIPRCGRRGHDAALAEEPRRRYLFPTLKMLRFGWAEDQGTKMPFEAHIDEIAIAPNRIGCEQ
jgi:hypothetical protein